MPRRILKTSPPTRLKRPLSKLKTINLDLGCGKHKQEHHFVGMDLGGEADIVHDPLVVPWPIPDNCVATVVAHHLWPRIPPFLTLLWMAELHRVCRHDARIFLTGPYGLGTRFVANPTYCNPTNEQTFHYWDPAHALYETYEPPPFEIVVFERVPVARDVDFNVVLRCLKKPVSPTLPAPSSSPSSRKK